MTDEPLAVVAALQPSSTVYDRASRLTHRPLWVFTVSFAVSAYFLMMAIFQLPNLYEESSAIMLTGLNAGITVLALGLLFGKMMSRRKMKKTAYERAVHRNGTFPTVYRFYEDAVETVSLRSRVMIPYSDVIAAVEDSYGFYISNGELVVMLPAAGLTAYDAAFIRDLLCQRLPAGVYRRHQAINARMPQPHAIPLYPEQPVVPPQLLHHPEYEHPFAQTFTTLLFSALPMLMLLTAPVATTLMLLCGITDMAIAILLYIALLLLTLFPFYLYAKRTGSLMQSPIGITALPNGWRLYRREGEWLLLPEDVLIRRIGSRVQIATPFGELLTDVDSCLEIPEISRRIGL